MNKFECQLEYLRDMIQDRQCDRCPNAGLFAVLINGSTGTQQHQVCEMCLDELATPIYSHTGYESWGVTVSFASIPPLILDQDLVSEIGTGNYPRESEVSLSATAELIAVCEKLSTEIVEKIVDKLEKNLNNKKS